LSIPRNKALVADYSEQGNFSEVRSYAQDNARLKNLARAGEFLTSYDPAQTPPEKVLTLVSDLKEDSEIGEQILKRGFTGAVARGSLEETERYLDSGQIESEAMRPFIRDVLANPGYLGILKQDSKSGKPLQEPNVPKAPVSALTDPGFFNPSLLDGILNNINSTMVEIASPEAGNQKDSQGASSGWNEDKEKKYREKVQDLGSRAGVDICKENPELCKPITYLPIVSSRPKTRVLCMWHCHPQAQGGYICACNPGNQIKGNPGKAIKPAKAANIIK